MHLFYALLVVNLAALALIYVMPKNVTPLYLEPGEKAPHRLCGIFSTRDIIITFVAGGIVAYLSDSSVIWGAFYEFVLGIFFHLAFSVRTMSLYKLGLSGKPNGLGRLANPISKPTFLEGTSKR